MKKHLLSLHKQTIYLLCAMVLTGTAGLILLKTSHADTLPPYYGALYWGTSRNSSDVTYNVGETMQHISMRFL